MGEAPRRVKEMTQLDIERAIVATLAERARLSCIHGELGRLVLRRLGLRLRGRRRQGFLSRLSKAVKHLRIARAPIVRVYKATTNIRIRLTDGYEEKFRRRVSSKTAADRHERARRRGPLGNADGRLPDSVDGAVDSGGAQAVGDALNASELDDLLSDEASVDEDLAVPAFEPPDLPDEEDEEELADFPDDDTDVPGEDGEEDTERKLGRLFGSEGEAEEATPRDEAVPISPSRLSANDVLVSLQEALDRRGLLVDRSLNELTILANPAHGIEFELSVRYATSPQAVYVQARLPYREDRMHALLRLAGGPGFASIICVRERRREPAFVVRRTIPLDARASRQLPDLIIELIGDARRAAELLQD
ncbi:hypothetical protein ACFL09_01775 [Planctomycetota bacterium]